MISPIAKIAGLFKAGQSGVGGQFQPFDKIDGYLWKTAVQCRIVYGLIFNEMGKDILKDVDAVIIDILYDGVCIKDPHRSNPMSFVTNYPGANGGRLWYSFFTPPSYTKYLAPGWHTVTVRVAPRKFAQWMRGRDFSADAGGVTQSFKFEVIGDGTYTGMVVPPQ